VSHVEIIVEGGGAEGVNTTHRKSVRSKENAAPAFTKGKGLSIEIQKKKGTARLGRRGGGETG